MDREQTKARIGNLGAIGLISLALLFDGAQAVFGLVSFIPVIGLPIGLAIGFVIDVCAYAFLLIFIKVFFTRVKVIGGRNAALKLIALFSSIVIEILPLISIIPAITAWVLTLFIATRIEDTFGGEKEIKRFAKVREQRAQDVKDARDRRLEAAKKRDEKRGGGGTRNQERAIRESDRQERKESRRQAKETAGIAARLVTGDTSKRNRYSQQAPGTLREQRPEEEGISGFETELERNEQY